MNSPHGAATALLIEGLEAGYDERRVLEGIDARLERGEAAALLGPNGSGKSTLLKTVLGLLTPWAGRVEVYGRRPDALDHRRWQIGYVPQLREVDRSFPASAADVVMMGRVGRLGLLRRPGGRDQALVREVLKQVGLADRAGQPFGALSGGQQQRVFLARALAQVPDLLVLDEPVAGVDDDHRRQIGQLLESLKSSGVPLLVATHDLDELLPLRFDQHWTLRQGQLAIDRPGDDHEAHAPDHHELASNELAAERHTGRFGRSRRLPGRS